MTVETRYLYGQGEDEEREIAMAQAAADINNQIKDIIKNEFRGCARVVSVSHVHVHYCGTQDYKELARTTNLVTFEHN